MFRKVSCYYQIIGTQSDQREVEVLDRAEVERRNAQVLGDQNRNQLSSTVSEISDWLH